MLSILHPAPIDTINSSPLRSPHKLSPRRLEWSFFLIESGLDGHTTRQYTPSTSLNIFIDKASPKTTSQRTRVERLVPLQTHTAATHISADNKYSPVSKTADLTKTAPRSIVGQLLRSLKPSTNIDFFTAVSHKTSPQIGRITAPKSIGFAAPPSGSQKTRPYRAVQTRALRSPAIHPPPVYI